jgi:hypothetical protein
MRSPDTVLPNKRPAFAPPVPRLPTAFTRVEFTLVLSALRSSRCRWARLTLSFTLPA